jgi:exopolysaccharide biosynthesis polyprenyl glycosylphosphotransferase
MCRAADMSAHATAHDTAHAKARSKESIRLRLYFLNLCYDILALFVSFAAANLIALGSVMGEPGKPHGLVMFAMIAPVYAVLSIIGGIYGIRMLAEPREAAIRSVWALVQAAALLLMMIYFSKMGLQLSRRTLLIGLAFSALTLALVRQVTGRKAQRQLGAFPTLDILLTDGVNFRPQAATHSVDAAAIGINPERFDAVMAKRLAGVVGAAERVIVACASDRIPAWSIALKTLGAKGEILVPELMCFAPAKLAEFDHHPTVIVAGGPMQFRDRITKRLFDVIVAGIATLALSPVIIAAAIAVRLSSPGPILFRQERLGKDARPFGIYKFRTMRADMTDHGAERLTQKDDARVTRVGAFLRRTSIDELPQLFNVLNGDMSLVGPRPHAPAARAADQLYWEVDSRYWERHCIKPGMTGLAQVRGHRGATMAREDLVNRLQSDLEYVTDWSLARDLRIILATMRVVIHENAF